jgi:hypothetical protein
MLPSLSPAAAVPTFPDAVSALAAVAAATNLPLPSRLPFRPADVDINLATALSPPPPADTSTTPNLPVDSTTPTVTMTPTTTTTLPSNPTSTPALGPASGPVHSTQPTPGTTGECRLLGSFAILVQLALGALALLALVYKRWRERPQRPVKIWWFDVSKQVFGSVLVHAANVFMSLLTSGRFSISVGNVQGVVAGRGLFLGGGDGGMGVVVRRAVEGGLGLLGVVVARGEEEGEYVPNPCSFYLLNLGIDVSISGKGMGGESVD